MPVKPRRRPRSDAGSARSKRAASARKAGRDTSQSVRAAEVARAKKLAADPNYPPKKVLQAVARVLARKLTG